MGGGKHNDQCIPEQKHVQTRGKMVETKTSKQHRAAYKLNERRVGCQGLLEQRLLASLKCAVESGEFRS